MPASTNEKNAFPGNPERTDRQKGVVVIRNLVKRYPGYYLLIEELVIPCGVVGLLGESGSGKSTLLNTLAALDPDYRGAIEVGGEDLAEVKDLDELRRDNFSFLFQSSNLLMNFLVEGNVELSRSIRANSSNPGVKVPDVLGPLFPKDTAPEKMKRLCGKFASELSGGMKQRVAVARALLKARDVARVLFADEPTANIDKVAANSCIEQLSNWAHGHKENLLLFATHDLNIARTSTEHLVLLGFVQVDERKSLIERVWKAGNYPEKDRPNDIDKVYTVVKQGSTLDTYEAIQEILIPGSGPQIPAEDSGRRPSTASGISDIRPGNNNRRLSKRAGFLMRYFLEDIKRWREWFPNCLRVATNTMLFVWLLLAASLYAGVPRIADQVFREDPLLRLVELRSLSNFPMPEEVLSKLAALSLDPVTGDVVSTGEGQPLIAGAMPVMDFANRWYRKDGTIQLKWVNGGRWTFGVETEEDPLFKFWNLEPLTLPDGIMIKGKVLADLGYDVDAFTARVEDPEQEAFLDLDVYDRITVRVDRVVEEFPDPALQLIIPAELAHRIKMRQTTLSKSNSPFLSFRGYTDMGSASKHRDVLAAVIGKGIPGVKGEFWLAAEKRPGKVLKGSSPEFQITVRPPDRQAGLANSSWSRVIDAYHGITDASGGGAHPHVFGSLPDDTSAVGLAPPPRESNRATLFVTDYRHIPMIIDYIDDQRGELKVEVSNKENKESIRTAQLCTQLGQLVLGLVTLALLVISTVSLTYSFLPQIHAKIGEIGILRAYGESRWFIVNRFLMEVALTCVAGFALAILLYSGLVLPYLNALAVERAPTLFEANAGGPLVVEPSGIFYSLIAFGCSLLFVGLVVTKKVRMSPSALLRMAD